MVNAVSVSAYQGSFYSRSFCSSSMCIYFTMDEHHVVDYFKKKNLVFELNIVMFK